MTFADKFGFLARREAIQFNGGWMRPHEKFDEGLRAIEAYQHKDGYLYPPLIQTYTGSFTDPELSTPVPNTVRPASVFGLPISHDLHIDNPISTENIRHSDAGLLVHLTAFFFGTRLQFHDWRFDGRVPIAPTNSFHYAADVPAHFVDWVYEKWKSWKPELRTQYINILYMHSRADSCEWEWDRFVYRYMVFDALYHFHVSRGGRKSRRHRDRLFEMCRTYGLAENEQLWDELVALRNGLFHEALWGGQTPGNHVKEDHLKEKWLRNLNAKLIVAVAGYMNEFVGRSWWHFGWQPFAKYVKEV